MMLYWGWIVCPCFLLLFTLSIGIVFSWGEIIIPLNKELPESLVFLEWTGAVAASLPMLLAPIATYLNFKLGTRKTVFIGVLITSMSLALIATVNSAVLLFFLYAILVGGGIVLIVNPPFFLLDEYFPYEHPRHVLATSIITCGFPLATLIFNPLTYVILEAVQWRKTYLVFAAVLFVVGSLTTMTFRHKYSADDPRTGEGELLPESEEDATALARKTKFIIGTLWFTVSVMKSIGYYTPFLTLVKQMEVLGIPQNESSVAMAVAGGCEIFSRLLVSYLGDYIKGKMLYMYVAFCAVLCVQNAFGSLAYTFTQLAIYAAALGLFGGPIVAAMYSSCSEVLQGTNVPTLFTVFRVGLGIGALIGPTLAGVIFDYTGSFHGAFYLNSALYLAASLIYGFIIYLNKRRPTWCFPDVGEQLGLVDNMKGTRTTENKDIRKALQSDKPEFSEIASSLDSGSDSTKEQPGKQQ